MPDSGEVLRILLGIAAILISGSCTVIAYFLVSTFKSSDDKFKELMQDNKDLGTKVDNRYEYTMRKISSIESGLNEAQHVIKSNREFLENSVMLQNSFLKEQIESLRKEMSKGFESLADQIAKKLP